MMKSLTALRPDGTNLGLMLLIALALATFTLMLPGRFLTDSTFMSMAFQLPELGLLTLAMFIAILSGGLNLAIIATANLTALFIAWTLMSALPAGAGMALQLLWLVIAIIGAMLIAAAIGVITGLMVTRIGAHPILVTLATMMTLNGIGIWLTKGAAVSGMPPVVQALGADTLLGMPLPLWVFLIAAALLALFLGKTRAGKCIYMGGSNINATWFSGINTHRMVMLVYVISSLLCVLAGLIMMARFNSAHGLRRRLPAADGTGDYPRRHRSQRRLWSRHRRRAGADCAAGALNRLQPDEYQPARQSGDVGCGADCGTRL